MVASIAVVLEAQAGRSPSPIVITGFIALSYLLRRWRRARFRLVTTTAEDYVRALGLGADHHHHRRKGHHP